MDYYKSFGNSWDHDSLDVVEELCGSHGGAYMAKVLHTMVKNSLNGNNKEHKNIDSLPKFFGPSLFLRE